MDINTVVACSIFSLMLWQYKRAMYLPFLSAIAFPADPQNAAFIAYVCVFFFGSVFLIMDAVLDIGDL